MNFVKEQDDYIYEKMYDEFKTPSLNKNKFDRWFINDSDSRNILHPSEWCVSFF